MPIGQIVNISNEEAIAEVSLKCGDPFFKDFPRNIYSQAVYRAERGIAKHYGILDRVLSITNTAGTSPVTIVPLNFHGEYRVTVTPADTDDTTGVETNYIERKLEDILDNADSATAASNYYYSIMFNTNQRELYYTWPVADDTITIHYTASISGTTDYEGTDAEGNDYAIPVLPNKFYEEVLRQAVRYMAKLAIAKFDGLKAQRAMRVLNSYTRRTDEIEERHLEKSRPWIQIGTWNWWD